jgi:hypothetical protein
MQKQQNKKSFVQENGGTVDVDRDMKHIIKNILNGGSWIELKVAIAYYGKDKVANVVKDANWLDELTHSFCSVYFRIPKEEFKCYSPSH